MSDQPQPGDMWKCGDERREFLRVFPPKTKGHSTWVGYISNGMSYRRTLAQWMVWQAKATLIQRGEPPL